MTGDITPAPLTITGASADDKVYDGTTTATLNTTNASLVGVVSGDSVSLNSTGATASFVSPNAGPDVGVSTSGFTISGPQLGDYYLIQPTLSATISPAPLTVTADDQSILVGGTIPPLTYTFSGLVGGDTSSVFSGSLTTSATSSSPIGQYQITQGSLSAGSNYTITFNPGTFTIAGYAVSIGSQIQSVTEGDTGSLYWENGYGVITLDRSVGDPGQSLKVRLGLSADGENDPQAVEGPDYTLSLNGTQLQPDTKGNFTVQFNANVTTLQLVVSATADPDDGTEGFRVTVLDGGTNYDAGWNASGGSGGSGWDGTTADVQIPGALSWMGPNYTWSQPGTQPPSITTPDNQSNAEGDTVSLDMTATAPSGDTLSYSAINLPPGLSIDPTTGVISGAIAYGAWANAEALGGFFTPTIIVSAVNTANETVAGASVSFNWSISDVLPAPVVTNPGNQANNTGDTVSLQVAASQADGDQLVYDASGLPDGLSIDPDTGLISGTIDPSAAGEAFSVTVTATDIDSDNLEVGSQTFTWNVATGAPTITLTNPGNQINAAGDDVDVTVSGTDSNGYALTYVASGLPTGLSIDPSSGEITGTISNLAVSATPSTVTVEASDGLTSSSQTFTWAVGGVSLANPGDQSNLDGDTVSLDMTATDATGGTLSYSATGLPTGLSIDAASGVISGTISNTADAGGPYTATVTASDGIYSASQTFAWNVAGLALNAPDNQTNVEGTSVSLTLSASDNIGSPIYSATGLPNGLSLNSTTGVISGTIAQNAHGSSPYQVTVTATDGTSSDTQSFVWTVTPQIALASPGPQSNAAGDTVSLSAAATDSAAGTLSYSATGLPTGLSINASTGLISGTISSSAASANTVTVTASDGTYTSTQTFSWAVSAINLPTLAAQDNMDDDTVSLSAAASYHGSGTLTYSATGLPTGLSIDPTTGLISGTIANTADASDPYQVTVTVTDGTSTASSTFNWEVDPRITLDVPGDQTNVPGDSVSVSITADDAATDAGPLTYSATGLPGGLSINSSTGVISGTITGGVSTTPYAVTVTVSDGVATASETFNWTLAPVTLSSVPDQVNLAGATVSLALSADVASGYTVSYSATDLPAGLSINSSTGVISGMLSAGDTGQSDVTVTATAGGVSTNVAFNWTVGPIVLAAPTDQTNTEGDSVSLTVSGETLSGTLSYSAVGLPTGLSIDPETGVISGTVDPGAAANGPYTPTVIVSNGSQAASQTFNWSIAPKISVTSIADQSNVEGNAASLQVTASEPGVTLSYSAAGLPSGLSINPSSGLISGTIASGDSLNGPFSVDVTVSDGTYSTDVAFNWNITNGSTTPPTLTNPGTQINAVGDNVTLAISASDADGGSISYDVTGLPDGLSFDPSSGTIFGAVDEDAVSTLPYTVTVTATDTSSGTSATQTFSWLVNDSAMAVTTQPFTATEGIDTGNVTAATFTNSDPNWTSDEFLAMVNWGDGTSDQGLVTGEAGDFTVSDDHIYNAPGSYTVQIEISDNPDAMDTDFQSISGGFQTVSATESITVNAAPLTMNSGLTLGTVPGASMSGTVGSFTDGNLNSTASNFTATIAWGDGFSTTGTITGSDGAFIVAGNHSYSSKGNYTVTVVVTGTDGASGTATSTVQVGDVFAGEQATLTVASFQSTDSTATAGQFSATINWGDGNTSPGTVTGTYGYFTVEGTHSYAANGIYTVTVTVNGPQDETITTTNTVSVVNPGLTGFGSTLVEQTLSFTNANIANFTDPNLSEAARNATATANWGDGTTSSVAIGIANGMFQLLGSHTYAKSGNYSLQILIDFGGSLRDVIS